MSGGREVYIALGLVSRVKIKSNKTELLEIT